MISHAAHARTANAAHRYLAARLPRAADAHGARHFITVLPRRLRCRCVSVCIEEPRHFGERCFFYVAACRSRQHDHFIEARSPRARLHTAYIG